MTLGQASVHANGFLGAIPPGNGPQNTRVVVRLLNKILQQEPGFGLHEVIWGKQLPADIVRNGLLRVDPLPIGRDTAKDGVDGYPFIWLITREKIPGIAKSWTLSIWLTKKEGKIS
jgi:hypothetical protein